jgi:Fic family protein
LHQTEALLKSTAIDLNHRQKELLSHALRHPDTVYTIKSYQTINNVVYQTARTDLFELADQGLLVKKKHRHSFVFEPIPDLDDKIKQKK